MSAQTIVPLIITLALVLIPWTRDRISGWLAALRQPSPRARLLITCAVAIVTIVYIYLTALEQERDLIPKFHDEHMHLLQMRMLAHGRLWMPALPEQIAPFLETFHVLVEPVYASIYFPGTALLYVPAVWLKLPNWVLPLLVAGACAAMLYRVIAELLDGVAGLLAALMLVSLQWFRYLAMMVMSHSVMLLAGLVIVWAWLHWRRERRLTWAAATGAACAFAAITRPVDALVYSIPVGIAMLIALRNDNWRRRLLTIAVLLLAAAPFLALQVIQNIGITNDPLRTPYRLYADLYTPQMSFGFHDFDQTMRPRTTLPQRQDYYDQFTLPAARQHRPDRIVSTWLRERFPLLARVTLPHPLLWALWLVSLFALRDRSRVVLWVILPLYIGFYTLFAYLLPWYCMVSAPSAIAGTLMGKETIERWLAARRDIASTALTLAIASLTIANFPQFDREKIDDGYLTPTMWFSYKVLPQQVQPPAIVLFRYRPGDNVNEEPVYNVDVAWPDDAPIIRAHDLGERNVELFDYYAKRQPQRAVYLFDRRTRTLARLGNVADLARQLHQRGPSSSGPM